MSTSRPDSHNLDSAEWIDRDLENRLLQSLDPAEDPVTAVTCEPLEQILADGQLVQIVHRRSGPDGECHEQWRRVRFAPGQAIAVEHVSFSPHFHARPECEAEVVAGGVGRIKISVREPFGARLEMRRSLEVDLPAEWIIRFEARAARESITSNEI